ncbi:TolC family protein [Methyloterricola oryzae]|uniref:TolC family protein n=1 Tax=Methyloterricola oryzae TaxID=1495050 RepID=UPI0009E4BE1B|nr:TolC family protein [Methyloterricola oryzae]
MHSNQLHHPPPSGRAAALGCFLILLCSFAPVQGQTLTLGQVLSLLEGHNPTMAAARARQESAQAAMVTARMYPNPELETSGGTSTGIGPGSLNGPNEQLLVAQPLDLPFMREARRKVAEAGITSADEANRYVWLTVRAQARQAFYEIIRRQSELQIAQDNERLLSQIRDKVTLRVDVGEAPRYEQVKAEAEHLNAVKLRESAIVRVEDAKSALRALFGPVLPRNFDAQGELPATLSDLPTLETLRDEILARQPALHQARAEVERAEAKLRLEEKSRWPVPTLITGVERDPGLEQWRVGFALPLPIWNQRQGPIGEARADLQQSEALANLQELTVLRELESAYNRYRIAQRQVETFESGLLRQAEATLKVAEAAYRLGERGILDYLDAQRVFRSVRLDFLNARFDRQAAVIDLERLRATELKDIQP